MARFSEAESLARKIDAMKSEYASLKGRIAELDALFARLGISAEGGVAKRRGRPPKGAAGAPAAGKRGGRRKRGTFAQTGEESVLAFIKSHGSPSAAEVNKHWSGEGRGGKADNTLTRLVKEGKLKRLPAAEGERGGKYKVA